MLTRLVAPALVAAAFAFAAGPAAVAAEPAPFGHACTAAGGVRLCPATTLEQRVPSFDGVPIDVDVTLPPTGTGPWPTIVLLHGFTGSKLDYEKPTADGWNSGDLARHGYAVMTTSARGFGRSCGTKESRTADCARGWIHLADQRYEVRDTQELLGRLVDQGIARRDALAASGDSYGGGQSLQLAFLRDQIRLPDGRFAPWRSPKGTRLALTAAYPMIPWSDMRAALLPNGRERGFASPIGVPVSSYVNGLLIAANLTGFVAPAGADPDADITTWKRYIDQGDPYGAAARASLQAINVYHGVGTLMKRTPAPLLLSSGWTDDLFPVAHTLRVYDALRARNRRAPVWLQYGDLGHNRGGSHAGDLATIRAQALTFMDRYLKKARRNALPAPGSLLAFGQRCPRTSPHGLGPWRVSSYAALSRSRGYAVAGGPIVVSGTDPDPALSAALDPLFGKGADACAAFPGVADDAPGVRPVPVADATTYLGRARVSANVTSTGSSGQLVVRLWDQHGATRTLVDRAVYRLTPRQHGRLTFLLHGNGYRFAPGHRILLEVLGTDSPTHRTPNEPFTATVSRLHVDWPTPRR